jgi:hypothetical protein
MKRERCMGGGSAWCRCKCLVADGDGGERDPDADASWLMTMEIGEREVWVGLQTDSKISDIIRDSIRKKTKIIRSVSVSVFEEICIHIRRNPYPYPKNFNGYGYGLAITYP